MKTFKEYAKRENGTYACLQLSKESSKILHDWCMDHFGKSVDPSTFHCTIMYSRVPVPLADDIKPTLPIVAKANSFEIFQSGNGSNCVVLRVESQEIEKLHFQTRQLGASYDYPEYKAHVTLCADYESDTLPIPPDFVLIFDEFKVEPLDVDMVTTNA